MALLQVALKGTKDGIVLQVALKGTKDGIVTSSSERD